MKNDRGLYHHLNAPAVLLLFGMTFGFVDLAVADERKEEAPASLGEALKKGKVSLNLRYRYETVSQDGFVLDAGASTLRATLSYRSRAFHGFSIFAEAENVTAGGDDYNNAGRSPHLANGVTDRPVVADPELTEVNQAYLGFGWKDTRIRIGREEVTLGNVRFVGNVGWRQNHQTFDTISVVNNSLGKATLTYLFIDDVNRIFGDHKPMSSHLVNATVKVGAAAKLALYGYFLDYDEIADSGLSTATVGASFTNQASLGGSTKLLYDFEYAVQGDHGDNPNEVDVSYYRGVIGAGGKSFSARVGYEVLEGGPGNGKFTTPLATLHAWNGWADKFLATPAEGLEDRWLALDASFGGSWKLAAVYHDFSADAGGAGYGEEIDLLLTFKTSWKQTFGFKAALYSADTHATDTDKIWAWAAWKL